MNVYTPFLPSSLCSTLHNYRDQTSKLPPPLNTMLIHSSFKWYVKGIWIVFASCDYLQANPVSWCLEKQWCQNGDHWILWVLGNTEGDQIVCTPTFITQWARLEDCIVQTGQESCCVQCWLGQLLFYSQPVSNIVYQHALKIWIRSVAQTKRHIQMSVCCVSKVGKYPTYAVSAAY